MTKRGKARTSQGVTIDSSVGPLETNERHERAVPMDRMSEFENRPGNEESPHEKPTFLERVQRHMAAIAYAEAGEHESAKELLETPQKSKTILLVIEGESPDSATFAHALSLCKRTRSELDILQVISNHLSKGDYGSLSEKMALGSRNMVDLVRQLEQSDIPFKLTIRLGEVSQKLFNYARRHKDVVMVIVDSPAAREESRRDKVCDRMLEEISRQLSIPVTTVLRKSPAPAGP